MREKLRRASNNWNIILWKCDIKNQFKISV